jgi:hypothetical protein
MVRSASVWTISGLVLILVSGDAGSQPDVGTAREPAAEASPTLVNSKYVRVHHAIRNVGPSGVGKVELWFTRDRQDWHRAANAGDGKGPLTFDAPGDGRYGLTVVASSGAGVVGKRPQKGDAPQHWLEVDTVPPTMALYSPGPGQADDAGKVILKWTSSDKNLGRRPIALYYATDRAGPWHLIAENLENTGRYAWKPPAETPPQVFFRGKATDAAGNTSVADTPAPQAIDWTRPEAQILSVEAVK